MLTRNCNVNRSLNANANQSLNLTPKGKIFEVMKKIKKETGSRQDEIRT